ncbi:MAG: hypothetical protein ABI718_14480 [Acidobacteriota bacterium]
MNEQLPWLLLGGRSSGNLQEARLQLHWAAQVVSSLASTMLPASSDDSHTNLCWMAEHRCLAGRFVTGDVRAALRLHDITLLLLNGRDEILFEEPFEQRTLTAMFERLSAVAAQGIRLNRPTSTPPDHPVAHGDLFSSADEAAFEELSRWFGNSSLSLERIAASDSRASEVRCWPHHFDIATLLSVSGHSLEGTPQTIGMGMTPGDGTISEPYFYVTPWPVGSRTSLPQLEGGEWHHNEWFGAVLRGSEAAADSTEAGQKRTVEVFLQSATVAALQLIV